MPHAIDANVVPTLPFDGVEVPRHRREITNSLVDFHTAVPLDVLEGHLDGAALGSARSSGR